MRDTQERGGSSNMEKSMDFLRQIFLSAQRDIDTISLLRFPYLREQSW